MLHNPPQLKQLLKSQPVTEYPDSLLRGRSRNASKALEPLRLTAHIQAPRPSLLSFLAQTLRYTHYPHMAHIPPPFCLPRIPLSELTFPHTTATRTSTEELVGSATLIQPLLSTATGDLLHIGPGSGTNIPYLPAQRLRSVVAVEPAIGLHAELLRNVHAAGLANRYRVLGCGAQPEALVPALAKAEVLQRQGAGGASRGFSIAWLA